MEGQVCRHFKYGFCKFKDECKDLFACKAKVCNKRHPKVCKRFSLERFCKFGSNCVYLHLIDTSVQLHKQLNEFDIKRSKNELQIKVLEDEVNTLKSQINQLATLYTDLSDKFDEFTKNRDPSLLFSFA